MSPLTDPDVLRDTTAEILEDAAFFVAAPASEADPLPDGALEASLDFHGQSAGTLRLRTTPAFGLELAANLLGIEADDPEAEAQAPAALGELVNIVTGALVAQWFGVEHICQLGIPRLGATAAAGAPALRLALLVDDAHRLDVDLFVAP